MLERQKLVLELEPVQVFGSGDEAHVGRAHDGDAQSIRENGGGARSVAGCSPKAGGSRSAMMDGGSTTS